MSDENVETVRSNYAHLNEFGEPDRGLYADEPILDASRFPGFGTYGSLDDFLAGWHEYRDTFDEYWIELEELLDGKDDRVFAGVRDGGRMKSSGGEVRNRYFHVWQLRAGKFVAWTVFVDRSEALEAAGLSE